MQTPKPQTQTFGGRDPPTPGLTPTLYARYWVVQAHFDRHMPIGDALVPRGDTLLSSKELRWFSPSFYRILPAKA